MNKRERMKALFSNEETDYVPAGFGSIIRQITLWNSIWKVI